MIPPETSAQADAAPANPHPPRPTLPNAPPPPPPPKAPPSGIAAAMPPMKLGAIILLALALVLPHLLISAVIDEREERQRSVELEVGRSWGRSQALLGPVLVLPYIGTLPAAPDRPAKRGRGQIAVLPTTLQARVALAPETRRRGLFETTVYTAQVAMEGSLAVPPVIVPGVADAEIQWGEAYLLAGSSDLRQGAGTLALGGQALVPSELPVTSDLCGPAETVRWPVSLAGPGEAAQPMRFTYALELRGTGRFHMVPQAGQTTLQITAPWATPSFDGAALPDRSDVTEAGFTADWTLRGRGSLLRQDLRSCYEPDGLGVTLLEPVPTHRMVSRSAKYAMLFVALAFVTYLCFELVARVRIHVVQYGLLGCSIVLFPLLLLALGEPLGFGIAYLLTSLAILVQASAYTGSVTGRPRMGVIFAGVLTLLFGFLYVVLSLEAYALLAGALALFGALSAVMVVTRRVQW